LIEGVREGLTDPGEVGLAGAIVEGEHEDDSACRGGRVRILHGKGTGSDCRTEQKGGEGDAEIDAEWKEPLHRLSIELALSRGRTSVRCSPVDGLITFREQTMRQESAC